MCEKYHFKVVFIGDTGVGKTSIIHKFLGLTQNQSSTLGATSSRIVSKYKDLKVVMNIWDTAGQESLRDLVPIYAKGSHAVVIVCDQSKQETFDHVDGWYKFITNHVDKFKCVLVANKSDLKEIMNIDDAYSWAESHNIDFIRTSTVDGTNINPLFYTISKKLYELYQEMKLSKKPEENEKETNSEKSEVSIVKISSKKKTNKKNKKQCS